MKRKATTKAKIHSIILNLSIMQCHQHHSRRFRLCRCLFHSLNLQFCKALLCFVHDVTRSGKYVDTGNFCGRSYECCLPPVIRQACEPPRRKNMEHTHNRDRGTCPTISPLFITVTAKGYSLLRVFLLQSNVSPSVAVHIS